MRRAIWMALAFMGTAPLVALAQQNTGAQAPAGSPSGTTSIDRGQDTNAIDAPGAAGQQSAGTVGTAQGQPATGGAGPFGGTGGGGTGGGGGQAAAQQAPLSGDAMQRELTTLRERVARLEGQVRDLSRGTGGAGTGGGGTGGGTTDTSNVRAQGPTVVATVTFDGTVRSVSSNRIQVVDREDGSVYNMRIDRGTRVSDDGKALNPRELTEGTPVRASLAFIAGEEHARDIVVIDEETQRLRQQQQRQQRQQRLEGMGPGQRLMQPDAPPRTRGGLPGSSTR
ncbi:hypothetical protein [Archangium sp.]|uniref:hypothetical protein n=1 Tax=Archangium sp. TaxID=1872627 RepID=UPI00286A0ED1|nr:hypothetical protein [Archangium sp.]